MRKYGFIARVYHEKDNAIFPYCMPDVAPAIAELNAYPEYHIIDRARAEDFCRQSEALIGLPEANNWIKDFLFGEIKWKKILDSFDGREPEIIIVDAQETFAGEVFAKEITPENLAIKFRLALDENGGQVRAADYIKPIKTAQIKYGYIARTRGANGFGSEIPIKAWRIPEGERYPEVYFIEPERAANFLLVPKGINIPTVPPIVSCGILFSKEQWQEIIKSFDGHEPEIFLCDVPPMIEAMIIPPERKRLTPENLRVKLRVAFDENDKRITTAYTEGLKSRGIPKQSKPAIAQDMLIAHETWKKSQREKFKDVNDWRKIEPSNREQMIDRLINQASTIAFNRVQEYEQRIRQMTDEQIEKEYRMEFGE